MAARQNYYAESTAESTHTGDTLYTDKTTLTFTPDDNGTYYIIASWQFSHDNATVNGGGKLTRTTGTAKDFTEVIYRVADTTDYITAGVIGVDTFGASPGSQTYKIQFKTNNAANTAQIKEAKIIAIKAGANDQSAQAETRTTTTATTFQDKTTLTFTPGSTGDYIIIASAVVDADSITQDAKVQLDVDGTPHAPSTMEPDNVNQRMPWGVIARVNLTAASHTIKIQFSAETSNTVGINSARVLALRADDFDNNYYGSADTRTTTTSSTYQDKTTLTQTPQAVDHLILTSSILDGDLGTESYLDQLLEGATTIFEESREPSDITNVYATFALYRKTLAASSTTWKTQFKSETSMTTGIDDSRISIIQLDATPAAGQTVDMWHPKQVDRHPDRVGIVGY